MALSLLLTFAALPAGAGEMSINGVRVLGEEPVVEARDWSACRVRADLVQTGPEGTRTIASVNRVLMLGEDLDFEGVYTLSDGKRQALVQLLVKLRSSTVRQDGAMYLVTSEGDLQAAVGFTPEASSRTQFRHDFIELGSSVVSPREVYVSPELGIRVLLVVAAEPLDDELEEPLLPRADAGDIVRFKVQAKRRFDGKTSVLSSQSLQASPGHAASFSVVLRESNIGGDGEEAEGEEEESDQPYGRVRVAEVERVQPSPFGDEGRFVEEQRYEDDFMARNARRGDTSYMGDHEVARREGPVTTSMRVPRKKKLSKKKIAQLKASAEIRAAREMAVERSKTLAGDVGVPELFGQDERLEVVLTPVHATDRNLRLRIRLKGFMALAGDAEPREIDLSFSENLEWGRTLELGLREILEGGEPLNDTILAITPQP